MLYYLIFAVCFRTDLCAFSEYRIYPGHGIKLIRKDGQVRICLHSFNYSTLIYSIFVNLSARSSFKLKMQKYA